MDTEERLQQWLDDYGFQGSVEFDFSLFFLQLLSWWVIAYGIDLASQ
jgi:hypothetical protein